MDEKMNEQKINNSTLRNGLAYVCRVCGEKMQNPPKQECLGGFFYPMPYNANNAAPVLGV